MADPFESSRRKLGRAKTHITDFERGLNAFMDERPYYALIDKKTDPKYEIHKIRFKKPIPDTLIDIAADAIQNLRDVLDPMGYGIAVAAGKIKPLHVNFPFAPDTVEFENKVRGRCKDLPDEIVALYRSFKPYKGGDDFLWALNSMAVTTKHKLLIPMAASAGTHIYIDSLVTGETSFAIGETPTWDSTKNEITFFKRPYDAHFQGNINASVFVAFGDVEIVSGQPADAILRKLASIVEGILMAVEGEARRLFPASF